MATTNMIELDDFYADLESGRWLIVAGERTDVTAPDPTNPEGSPSSAASRLRSW